MANPNRVRALIGAFALANQTQFNRADGAGYDFVVDTVLALDPKNPQVAARLLTALKSWRVLEPGRRARAESGVARVAAAPSLSRDVGDIVQRALAPADHSSRYRRLTGVNEWGFRARDDLGDPSDAGIRNRSVAGEAKKPRRSRPKPRFTKT